MSRANEWIALQITTLSPLFSGGHRDAVTSSWDLARTTSLIGALRRMLRRALTGIGNETQVDECLVRVFGEASDDRDTLDHHPIRRRPSWRVAGQPRLSILPSGSPVGKAMGATGLNKDLTAQCAYLMGIGCAEHKQGQWLTRRPCLPTGQRWDVLTRWRQPGGEEQLLVELELLRAVELYSGLGGRTTRGLGAIRIRCNDPLWAKAVAAVPQWPRSGEPVSGGTHFGAWVRSVAARLGCQLTDPGSPTLSRGRSLTASRVIRALPHDELWYVFCEASWLLLLLRRPELVLDWERQRTPEWQKSLKPGLSRPLNDVPAAVLGLPLPFTELNPLRAHRLDLVRAGEAVRYPSPLSLSFFEEGHRLSWGSIFFEDSWAQDNHLRFTDSIGRTRRLPAPHPSVVMDFIGSWEHAVKALVAAGEDLDPDWGAIGKLVAATRPRPK